jgi:hypothetical protein
MTAAGAGNIDGPGEEAAMVGRRIVRGIVAASLPLALTVHSVLALGDATPADATPAPSTSIGTIDPGFIARAGGDVDPGFSIRWEDRSNDTGFTVVGPGATPPSPCTTPLPTTPAPPVITLGAP